MKSVWWHMLVSLALGMWEQGGSMWLAGQAACSHMWGAGPSKRVSSCLRDTRKTAAMSNKTQGCMCAHIHTHTGTHAHAWAHTHAHHKEKDKSSISVQIHVSKNSIAVVQRLTHCTQKVWHQMTQHFNSSRGYLCLTFNRYLKVNLTWFTNQDKTHAS